MEMSSAKKFYGSFAFFILSCCLVSAEGNITTTSGNLNFEPAGTYVKINEYIDTAIWYKFVEQKNIITGRIVIATI